MLSPTPSALLRWAVLYFVLGVGLGIYVAGSHDLVVHVVAKDVEHLRTLVADRFGGETVSHIETALIFQHRRRPRLPDLAV